MSERMCPCGNCHATWNEAVRDLMNGPAALNSDQAEAQLERIVMQKRREGENDE